MVIGGTTVGPLSEEVRDWLKEYKEDTGHPNYESAIIELLEIAHKHRDGPAEPKP